MKLNVNLNEIDIREIEAVELGKFRFYFFCRSHFAFNDGRMPYASFIDRENGRSGFVRQGHLMRCAVVFPGKV